MKNHDMFESDNETILLGELQDRINALVEFDSDFRNAQVFAEGDGVRHRMLGAIHEKERRRDSKHNDAFFTLLDEDGVVYEEDLRKDWDERLKKEMAEW